MNCNLDLYREYGRSLPVLRMIMNIVSTRCKAIRPPVFKVLEGGCMAWHLADTIFMIIVSRWQDLPFPALNYNTDSKCSHSFKKWLVIRPGMISRGAASHFKRVALSMIRVIEDTIIIIHLLYITWRPPDGAPYIPCIAASHGSGLSKNTIIIIHDIQLLIHIYICITNKTNIDLTKSHFGAGSFALHEEKDIFFFFFKRLALGTTLRIDLVWSSAMRTPDDNICDAS